MSHCRENLARGRRSLTVIAIWTLSSFEGTRVSPPLQVRPEKAPSRGMDEGAEGEQSHNCSSGRAFPAPSRRESHRERPGPRFACAEIIWTHRFLAGGKRKGSPACRPGFPHLVTRIVCFSFVLDGLPAGAVGKWNISVKSNIFEYS